MGRTLESIISSIYDNQHTPINFMTWITSHRFLKQEIFILRLWIRVQIRLQNMIWMHAKTRDTLSIQVLIRFGRMPKLGPLGIHLPIDILIRLTLRSVASGQCCRQHVHPNT